MVDLFGHTLKAASRPRRVIMHAVDAGSAGYLMPGWNTDQGAKFKCQRCGHDDGWTFNLSTTEIKRGIPCPHCNAELA